MNEGGQLRGLEPRLQQAFGEFAETLPDAATGAVPVPMTPTPHSRTSNRVRGVLIGAVAAAAAVAAAFYVASGDGSGTEASSVDAASRPRAESGAGETVDSTDAPAGAGEEVRLSVADGVDARHLLLIRERAGYTDRVAVQSEGDAAVVVVRQNATTSCMTIASAPTDAGYQGSCTPAGKSATAVAVANEYGPYADKASKWYAVWTEVPQGASYVTAEFQGAKSWQRPVEGVSYFTFEGIEVTANMELPVFRAYSADGTPLGEATVVR